MNLFTGKIHFTGIGGAGMAPLAELMLARQLEVSGSDLEYNEKCAALSAAGAQIFTGHAAENLPSEAVSALVYTSAASADNPELDAALKRHIPCLRRGDFLAEFAKLYKRCAAVSGSHGKSSISAMLAKLLDDCGMAPGFMIGAKLLNFPSCANGKGDDIFVTEADESDGTHTMLKPFLGIVPNIEDDHSWSVGGKEKLEENFRTFGKNCRKLIYVASPVTDRLFADHPDALRIELLPGNFAGQHGFQAANAYLAYRAALLLGCAQTAAEKNICSLPQVARRMTVHWQQDDLTVVEDYAHHPTELKCAIEYLRTEYPGRHLRLLFQPHRYARLNSYFDEFAAELQKCDSLYIMPVFAAWSEKGKLNSADLAQKCCAKLCSADASETANEILKALPENSVIAVLGAGDIENVLPHIIAKLKEHQQ